MKTLIVIFWSQLFDNDTDVDDDDDDGNRTPVVAAGGGLKQRGTMKQYDDDMMTRRVCAKWSDNKQIKGLTSHVVPQRQELSSLKATVVRNHDIQQQSSRIMNQNLVHMMKGVAFCVTPGIRGCGSGGGDSTATLALQNAVYDAEQAVCYRKERKNAYYPVIQDAYICFVINGIGVNKAAKLFTLEERGQVKHRYCPQKIFWDTIRQMVLQGWSAITACENINDVYSGRSSISRILSQMRTDWNGGGLPTVLLGPPL